MKKGHGKHSTFAKQGKKNTMKGDAHGAKQSMMMKKMGGK